MKNNRLKYLFLLMASCLIISGFIVLRFGGCDGDSSGVQLVSIEVTPINATVPLGRHVKFDAVGRYSDNRTSILSETVAWSSSDSGRAKINNTVGNKGKAVPLAEGRVFIVATDFQQGISGTAVLTVTPPELVSISVSPTAHAIHLGSFCKFTATGLYSDGSSKDITSELNWSSADTTAQIVSNSHGSKGICISPPSGSVNIIATDPLTGKSGQSTLSVKNVKLSSIAVAPEDSSLPLGGRRQFSATGTYRDGTTNDISLSVVWSSSDPSTAAISNDNISKGIARGVSNGLAVIKATEPHFRVSGSTTLNVVPPVLSSLAIAPLNPTVFAGDNKSLRATGIYSNGKETDMTSTVVWESSDTGIAFVGIDGMVETRRPGKVTIRAVDPLSRLTRETLLVVTLPVLNKIQVVPGNPSVFIGGSQRFKAIGFFSDSSTKNLTSSTQWATSNRNIVVISDNGIAKALRPGEASISATDTASGISGQTVCRSITPELTSIRIVPTAPSIHLGRHQVFSALGIFSDGETADITESLAWSSSHPSVAVIRSKAQGTVSAQTVSEGVTSVSAADPNLGIAGEAILTVMPAQLLSIRIDPPDAVLSLGERVTFKAIGFYTDGKTKDISGSVDWSSSDDTVVGLINNGESRGVAESMSIGTADIIAEDPHSGIIGKANVAGRALW